LCLIGEALIFSKIFVASRFVLIFVEVLFKAITLFANSSIYDNVK
jgi:hypothetical protein